MCRRKDTKELRFYVEMIIHFTYLPMGTDGISTGSMTRARASG